MSTLYDHVSVLPVQVPEVRKSNLEGPQLRVSNFFCPHFRKRFVRPPYCGNAKVRTTVFCPHFRKRFVHPPYCGNAEVRTTVAYFHVCILLGEDDHNDNAVRCEVILPTSIFTTKQRITEYHRRVGSDDVLVKVCILLNRGDFAFGLEEAFPDPDQEKLLPQYQSLCG
jgi:hypothetical protein